jgi:hypothetical protein
MTEPLTDSPPAAANGTTVRAADPVHAVTMVHDLDGDGASPPGTPRWVKALGIVLVVLLLGLAGLHLTGHAPTHMPGASGPEHGQQVP